MNVCEIVKVVLYIIVPGATLTLIVLTRYPLLRRRRGKLTPYGVSYHAQLVAEYEALPPGTTVPAAQSARIQAIVKTEDASTRTWDDLFALELFILGSLPTDQLQRKAWLIRQRYSAIAGKDAMHAYGRSQPPTATAPPRSAAPSARSVAVLRADLEVLLQDLYWLYRIRTNWEEARDCVSRDIGRLLVVSAIALFTIVTARAVPCQVSGGSGFLVVYECIFIGATGGLMSLLRRLQSVPSEEKRLSSLQEFENGRLTIIFQSWISGAIFAFVLVLMFTSGAISGTLFPKIATGQEAVPLLKALETLAGDGRELAKLLLWSFIGGFAETFVPDSLDRLVKSASR